MVAGARAAIMDHEVTWNRKIHDGGTKEVCLSPRAFVYRTAVCTFYLRFLQRNKFLPCLNYYYFEAVLLTDKPNLK